MCKFASMVLTKDHVYIGTTDSHEDIIAEHSLHEGTGRVNFVRVEITPPEGDPTTDPGTWTYRADQDVLPEWYDAEREECRTRAALLVSGLPALYADYEAKRDSLEADYEAKCSTLYADYASKRDSLVADYRAKCSTLYADYAVKRDSLVADYRAKCSTLYADYASKRDSLVADYRAKRSTLYADNRAKRSEIASFPW